MAIELLAKLATEVVKTDVGKEFIKKLEYSELKKTISVIEQIEKVNNMPLQQLEYINDKIVEDKANEVKKGLTDEEKTKIKEETGIELECFIHGAMCTSHSGRCVMSNYATLRDSNRGGCAQVCRFKFNIDGSSNTYSMTPKDLNMVPFISDMIDIGVNSFKVEGRMRSIYYIATVIKTYREIIDKVVNKSLNQSYSSYYLDILNRCANRDSTPQFFDKEPGVNEQYYLGNSEFSNQDFLGLVKSYNQATKEVIVEERNFFKPGDVVEFFGPHKAAVNFVIPNIYDENNKEIDAARHPKDLIKFNCDIPLEEWDMMRLKVFDIKDYL